MLPHLKDLLQEGEDVLVLQRCPVSASLQHADNVGAGEGLQFHTALQPLHTAEGLSARLPQCAGGAQRPQGGQLVLIPLQVSLQAQRHGLPVNEQSTLSWGDMFACNNHQLTPPCRNKGLNSHRFPSSSRAACGPALPHIDMQAQSN